MKSHNHALEMRESYRGPDLTVFVRDLRDRNRKRKLSLAVKTWSTIKDVKDLLFSLLHIPPNLLRIHYGPLLALPNHRTLQDVGIYRSGETLFLDILSRQPHHQTQATQPTIYLASSMLNQTPKRLLSLINQARRAMALGYKPKSALDGSGGTYFLDGPNTATTGVFKPADEEPYADNNPRGYTGHGTLRDGIQPGEACLREVAAYFLDHKGFSSVPMTTLVKACHPAFYVHASHSNALQGIPSVGNHTLSSKYNNNSNNNNNTPHKEKIGSFQAFVKAECSMDDMSPSKISTDQVHKIAILDIRLMNADRNSANLLVKRKLDNSLELIPIDHGFSLRSVCDVSWMDWCWLDWPQLKIPMSQKTKQYILGLNIDKDVRILKEHFNIQGKALNYFRASNKLLQQGVRNGLTLYEIAILCCRNDDLGEVPSKLEILTEMATELSDAAINNGHWHHTTASKAIADQLSQTTTRTISNFSALVQHNQRQEEIPGMTHSSTASDASSDAGDVVVEQWAAAIVKDVGANDGIHDLTLSMEDEDDDDDDDDNSESTSSPEGQGFWHVHPVEDEKQKTDDETIVWTPNISPQEPTATKPQSEKPTVTFVDLGNDFDENRDTDFMLPPTEASQNGNRSTFPQHVKAGKMKRSQSMGTLLAEEGTSTGVRLDSDHEDSWVLYFNKFADLVITRETKHVVEDASALK